MCVSASLPVAAADGSFTSAVLYKLRARRVAPSLQQIQTCGEPLLLHRLVFAPTTRDDVFRFDYCTCFFFFLRAQCAAAQLRSNRVPPFFFLKPCPRKNKHNEPIFVSFSWKMVLGFSLSLTHNHNPQALPTEEQLAFDHLPPLSHTRPGIVLGRASQSVARQGVGEGYHAIYVHHGSRKIRQVCWCVGSIKRFDASPRPSSSLALWPFL